ncbi:hypothetical protein NSERKGN1266_02220 [Nocardia seriolae]|nr:hypothetical protein NSERKGN1266_02220 [Nocardia seriolae]BEK92310.1 hypothetical protein NSER024013_02160 [Nocardia seriolae]GEM24474.1 hypothetical protein NS2_27130 [Nocardia seriolae NBRC 15557]
MDRVVAAQRQGARQLCCAQDQGFVHFDYIYLWPELVEESSTGRTPGFVEACHAVGLCQCGSGFDVEHPA